MPSIWKEQGNSTKLFRLLVVTDLNFEQFVTKVANTTVFKTLTADLQSAVAQAGWKFKVAITRNSDDVSKAIEEMESHWFMKNIPSGFSGLLLDIMMATLADFGFTGNPKSTLSKHIAGLRSHYTRDDLCSAHDAHDEFDSSCSATQPSTMDNDYLSPTE